MPNKPTYEALEKKVGRLELVENELKATRQKLIALQEIASLGDADLNAISNFILNTISRMTGSQYGFHGYLIGDETEVEMLSWSKKVSKDCSVDKDSLYFPIKNAGIWAEAIRTRKPFIMNDYGAAHKAKKGLPAGHVKINNLLVVPFIKDNMVLSVSAVANKQTEYCQDDITQVKSFLFNLQALVDYKLAEKRFISQQKMLDTSQEVSKVGSYYSDFTTGKIVWSKYQYQLFGYEPGEIEPSIDLVKKHVHPDDREHFEKAYRESHSGKQDYDVVYRIVRKDGKERIARSKAALTFDDKGNLIESYGALQDITQQQQAEEALRKSEERFKLAMEFTNDGLFDWNLQTDEIYYSPGWKRMLGYEDHEVKNRFSEWERLTRPEDVKKASTMLKELLDKKRDRFELEFKMRHKNGHWVDIFSRANAKFNSEGKGTRVIGTHVDITDLKRAEKERLESEKKFRDIFNSSADAIVIHDMEGNLLEANEVAYKSLGYSHDELLQLTPSDIERSDFHQYFKERAERFEKASSIVFQTVHRRKNGSEYPVEINSKKIEFSGKPCGLSIARDITERIRSDEKQRLLARMLDEAPGAIIIYNSEGRILYANQKTFEMHGYDKNEFMNLNLYGLNEPKKANQIKERMKKIAGKGEISFTEESLRKDGFIIPLSIYMKEVKWEGEKAFLSIATDLTEKLQAEKEKEALEAQIRQAQKIESIGTLAGGIAHDFNNILAIILGYTELAIRTAKPASTQESNLQEVLSASKRAKDLVWQILTFARQTDEETKPIQLDSIVREVLKFLRSSLPTTIEIEQNIHTDSLTMGNPTQMHQIIMNLCTNAAHAMDASGGILKVELKEATIKTSSIMSKRGLKPGNYIELAVSDTGTGIPPELIDSIFDPYFTTKETGKGTGLGLSVVQGIVEKSGGKITVESRVMEKTKFRVFLPVIDKQQNLDISEPEDLPLGAERILFVDDEVQVVKIGQFILEDIGYTVTTRTSSLEALELFKTRPNDFDLVITDMTMPNMTGDMLAIELMKIRSDIPVIICTGYSNKLSEKAVFETGIKALVYKPILRANLAITLRNVLDGTDN